MHDMWYAGKIIVALKERIAGEPKYNSIAVNIVLGPFTHVTEESLRGAFAVLNEKEGFSNVRLNIGKNNAVIKCKKCGIATEITGPVIACPKCDCADFDLECTEEFMIRSIEIE